MVLRQRIVKMHMENKTDSTDRNYNKCTELFVVLKKVCFGGVAHSVTNVAKE
jgi:hypothetical protein